MEYSIGEVVYYGDSYDESNLCLILNKAKGYSWGCLTGEDHRNSGRVEPIWFYHIKPINNPKLFYEDTNMCSGQFLRPYEKLRIKKEVKKLCLI